MEFASVTVKIILVVGNAKKVLLRKHLVRLFFVVITNSTGAGFGGVVRTDRFSSRDEYLEKYPGDEWVDVIGFDIYQRNTSNEKFIADIDKMLSTLEQIAKEKNKIPALTEFGGNLSDSSW